MLFGKEMNLPFDLQVIPKETMGKDANSILASFFENWRKKPGKTERFSETGTDSSYQQCKIKRTIFPYVSINRCSLKLKRRQLGIPKSYTQSGKDHTTLSKSLEITRTDWCSDNKLLKASIHANRLKTYHDPQDRRLQPNEHQTTGIGTNAQDEIDGLLQDQTEQLQNREIVAPHPSLDKHAKQTAVSNDSSNDWSPIKKILKSRYVQGKRQYLVRWEVNYPKCWLAEEDLGPGLIRAYHATRTMAGKKRKRKTTYFSKHQLFLRSYQLHSVFIFEK